MTPTGRTVPTPTARTVLHEGQRVRPGDHRLSYARTTLNVTNKVAGRIGHAGGSAVTSPDWGLARPGEHVELLREGTVENVDGFSLDIAHDIAASWVELEALG
jgi:hypothetical protein